MATALFNVRPLPRRRSKDFLLLMMLSTLLFSAGLGLRGPWPSDEPQLTLMATELLAADQWWYTTRNGEAYGRYLPLFPMLIAAAIGFTDQLRVGFLIPSLLFGIGTVLLVYDLAKKLWNPTVGLSAGIGLLLSVQLVLQARTAQPEIGFAFFTMLALWGWTRQLWCGPRVSAWALGWLGFALALCCHPLAPLLLCFWPVAWWSGALDRHRHSGLGGWLLIALSAAVASLPMTLYLAQLQRMAVSDPATASYLAQLWSSLADAWRLSLLGGDRGPHYYLMFLIPLFWLPLVLALPSALPAWRRRVARGDWRYALLLGLVVVWLAFLSFKVEKSGAQALFVLPLFALALAPLVAGLIRMPSMQRAAAVLTAVLAATLCGVGAVGWAQGQPFADRLFGLAGSRPWPFLLTVGLVGLISVWRMGSGRGLGALAVFLCTLWWLYGAWAYPLIDPERSGQSLMALVEKRLDDGDELGIVAARDGLVLMAQRPPKVFGFEADRVRQLRAARAWLAAGDGRRSVLVPALDDTSCVHFDRDQALVRQSRLQWYLVTRADALRSC